MIQHRPLNLDQPPAAQPCTDPDTDQAYIFPIITIVDIPGYNITTGVVLNNTYDVFNPDDNSVMPYAEFLRKHTLWVDPVIGCTLASEHDIIDIIYQGDVEVCEHFIDAVSQHSDTIARNAVEHARNEMSADYYDAECFY